jgi:hypothetical protein
MFTSQMHLMELKRRKAGAKTKTAINNGKIIKPNHCEKCKKERKLEVHHCDYNNPLEVLWLCLSCHRKLHMKLRGNDKMVITIKIKTDNYDFDKVSFDKDIGKILARINADYETGKFNSPYTNY